MIIPERKEKNGRGMLNKIIRKLPFNLNSLGNSYCGPGKKLKTNLLLED